MEKVTVLIEYNGNNFCAHAPILLGCVSTAGNLDEMKKNIKEAITFHVESSLEFKDSIPVVFKGRMNWNLNIQRKRF